MIDGDQGSLDPRTQGGSGEDYDHQQNQDQQVVSHAWMLSLPS
jgi:hypothetical protein